MYNYSESEKDLRILNEVINYSLGDDYIYRIIIRNYGDMILTFHTEEMVELFKSKLINKYTCDTSGLRTKGLSVFIGDKFIANSIVNKSIDKYEKDKEDDSSALCTE